MRIKIILMVLFVLLLSLLFGCGTDTPPTISTDAQKPPVLSDDPTPPSPTDPAKPENIAPSAEEYRINWGNAEVAHERRDENGSWLRSEYAIPTEQWQCAEPKSPMNDEDYQIVFYYLSYGESLAIEISPEGQDNWRTLTNHDWAGTCACSAHGIDWMVEKYCLNFEEDPGTAFKFRFLGPPDENGEHITTPEYRKVCIQGNDTLVCRTEVGGNRDDLWEMHYWPVTANFPNGSRYVLITDVMEFCEYCPASWRNQNN